MDILKKLQQDVSEGVSVLRKEGTSLLLRTMAEMDILKIKYDAYKVESHLAGLYQELGERFMEAIESKDFDILASHEIKDLAEKIETIRIEEERHIRELKNLKDIQKE